MKKRRIFLAFLAATFSITSLISCKNDANNSEVITETENQESNTETKETIENIDYKLADNEQTQMVYNDFKESYPNLKYKDFRINGTLTISNDYSIYRYSSSVIYLKDNALFLLFLLQ